MPPKKKAAASRGPPAKRAKKQAVQEEIDNNEDVSPTQEDLKKQTVATLRDTCTQLGLDTKGTKDTLIQRILEHHQTDEEQSKPSGVKLVKQESKNTQIRKAFEALKNEGTKPKSTTKVDQEYTGTANSKVHEDYACTLNQTNIGQNNNKFYIIQMIEESSGKKQAVYHVFARWGRVGEKGQQSKTAALSLDKAVKEFEKKFKDKTKNNWDERDNFVAQKGKYTLLEIDDDDDAETEDADIKTGIKPKIEVTDGKATAPCSLEPKTKNLVEMLFDKDMFNNAMQVMELDVRKMPLGKLSKVQIAKGFEVLVALEDAVQQNKNSQVLAELSSKFYTLIPHNFGRRTPTVLNSESLIQQKKDVLLVLSDIELAQSLQKDMDSAKNSGDQLKPHPVDVNYDLLHCNLSLLNRKSKEFEVINTYFLKTKVNFWSHLVLKDVWVVDRNGEDKRFARHGSVKERKLLWHGTNFAVVAAILSSGLRIMPHSGGRVGRGIYFASENSKSASYVGTAPQREGIMFLNEVVLGNEKSITKDDSSLRKAPSGYHSVVARGRKEPDPKFDVKLKIDGKDVVVPQASPVPTQYKDSYFDQSEYLVYDESQVRIRYLLMIQF